jgi:hypothetical protein
MKPDIFNPQGPDALEQQLAVVQSLETLTSGTRQPDFEVPGGKLTNGYYSPDVRTYVVAGSDVNVGVIDAAAVNDLRPTDIAKLYTISDQYGLVANVVLDLTESDDPAIRFLRLTTKRRAAKVIGTILSATQAATD